MHLDVPPELSAEEKRAALSAVLGSGAFERSAQQRALLRYVCEQEISGRAEELTQYRIATEVLGRPRDISPAEDSSVRNRIYELRQRLERYYATENPGAPVRIVIPHGGYAPRFLRQADPTPVAAPAAPLAPVAGEPRRHQHSRWLAVAAGLVCLAAGWLAGHATRSSAPPPALMEAWGPLAERRGDVLICIATNLHMLVRPHIPRYAGRMPAPEMLYPSFQTSRPLAPGEVLYMEPAHLSVPLAEVVGTATLARTLASLGVSYQILPESEAPLAALQGRNSFLIGTPVNSQSATVLLRSMPLTMGFDASDLFAVIDQRAGARQREMFTALPSDPPNTSYGMISVIPAHPGPQGHPRRTVVINGTGSPGVQAAIEYFSSPQDMAALKARFAQEGLRTFPASYQVVLRCKTNGIRLLSYEYATHVVARR